MTLLKVTELETSYGAGSVHRGVSLDVNEGEIVTILGPNGAGKTTMLHAIAGLLRPTGGKIEFDEADVTGRPADWMARHGVVLVPEGRHIFSGMTVLENLQLGGYSRRDTSPVEEDIRTMEAHFPILAERRNNEGTDLSGGQQQMLAIARGLMARPRILLLDEPSLGLSPILVKEVRDIIRNIRDEFNSAVLLVEQNAALALSVAERGYLMQTGEIVASGTISELRDLNIMRELYLGRKGTRAGVDQNAESNEPND